MKTPTTILFEKYIASVKEQLDTNATNDYKNNYITYDYSNKQVDENLSYFYSCMKTNLSPYKALLFFEDHLKK
jgi:hypothetical protein